MVEQGRPHISILHMHIACWIPKATNANTVYAILIAFPLQQWLHGRTSILCYMYVCLVKVKFFFGGVIKCTYADRYLCPDTILTANAVRTWNSAFVLGCHHEVTMANAALEEKQHWLILIKTGTWGECMNIKGCSERCTEKIKYRWASCFIVFTTRSSYKIYHTKAY
jgi:hypothetical protein